MTKLTNPLMSLKATGGLAKLFSLAKRQGIHIIQRKPIPTDAKSPAQLFNRNMFSMCKDLWHTLSDAEHQEWESLARPKHMSGYAWYLSQCLRPNPGIYLPLIGGKMSGEIDMDGNRIEDLPDPAAAQDAATKAYHDANKYTDGQVVAWINLHAAIAAAHHARYTNGEADARIALHAAIAAAHHAAFILAHHTAIGNGAPHHAKYTNAQAVAAAKTVKLDDFATPDDNADLNASAARHGLFKKLSNVATQFLNGLGNWVEVTGEAATKEFFLMPSGYIVGGRFFDRGRMNGVEFDASGELVSFEFFIPNDFSTITDAVITVIPYVTKTHRVNINAYYAAQGEAYNTHNELVSDVDTAMTSGLIYELDISGILSSLAAGDYVGVQLTGDSTNTADLLVLGIRFKYS